MRSLTTFIVTGLVALSATAGQAATSQDLRSPDARDSARQVQRILHPTHTTGAPEVSVGRIATSVPQPAAVPAPPVRIEVPADNGFRWGDAGIGAAGMLGLIALAAGTFWMTTQRRRDRQVRVAH